MLSTWVLLVLGFIFLIKGADFLVDGASSVAKKLGVSALVIGLTIVAFGTSMPELIVNVFASINGNTDIAIGNILGSNISNTLLILGVASIIYPLSVGKGTVWKEIPFGLFSVLLLSFLVNDAFIHGVAFSGLSRVDGLILLSLFAVFMYYIFSISRGNKDDNVTEEHSVKIYSSAQSVSFIIVGLLGLTIGGKWIVDSAVVIAEGFGISQSLIGLTIVAVGTSLPELVTSAVAAYKRNTDIAIGNIIGSNIFNVLWILGISSVIRPLPFSVSANRDVLMVIFSSLLLFLFLSVGKKHIFRRWHGVVFLILYIVYIVFIVLTEIH